jgi:transcriptional regulator with XRE-family HTH domain
MTEALSGRDVGQVFRLLRQYAGISQTRLAIACDMTQPKVSGIMRGVARVESLEVFERIADGLSAPDQARLALGLAPRGSPPGPGSAPQQEALVSASPARNTGSGLGRAPNPAVLSLALAHDEEDKTVQRRTFVGLTSASLLGTIFSDSDIVPGSPANGIQSLAAALADSSPNEGALAPRASDIPDLAAWVTRAKRGYQACQYGEVAQDLPALLAHVRTACSTLDGQALLEAWTLSAEAHHVAASILLKYGEQGPSWLAADRSMNAARASQDPVTIASSVRILTHAMSSSGHHQAAASTASTYAARLGQAITSHNSASLSVYGSLLLRGAIAAARHGDRRTAYELLSEADDAARRIGQDSNARWTAFGPANAQLHRVSVAVTLGDAGTALDVARSVDVGQVKVTERKASFLVEAARALLQCDRHEKALLALRAAEQLAPQEIGRRPAVRGLVQHLVASAPPSVRRQAREFADQTGVACE